MTKPHQPPTNREQKQKYMTPQLARTTTHTSKSQSPDQTTSLPTHCKKNFESTSTGQGTRPLTRIGPPEPQKGSPELQNLKTFKIFIDLQAFKHAEQASEKKSTQNRRSRDPVTL